MKKTTGRKDVAIAFLCLIVFSVGAILSAWSQLQSGNNFDHLTFRLAPAQPNDSEINIELISPWGSETKLIRDGFGIWHIPRDGKRQVSKVLITVPNSVKTDGRNFEYSLDFGQEVTWLTGELRSMDKGVEEYELLLPTRSSLFFPGYGEVVNWKGDSSFLLQTLVTASCYLITFLFLFSIIRTQRNYKHKNRQQFDKASKKAWQLELSLWLATVVAISVAIVFGHALDNAGQVFWHELARPTLFLSAIFSVLVFFCFLFCRPIVGLIPLGFYLLFTYSFANEVIGSLPFRVNSAFLFFILPLFLLHLSIKNKDSRNIANLSLLIFSFAAITTTIALWAHIGISNFDPKFDNQFSEDFLRTVSIEHDSDAKYPDIIYVVPDRYASSETLLTEFGYDNSKFYDDLRERSFTVVENSFANYPKTFQSLASTMNADYLEGFSRKFGNNTLDQRAAFEAIENNLAQDQLKKLGYQFVYFGNAWGPTERNVHAHENYQGYGQTDIRQFLTEFEWSLLKRSPAIQVMRQSNLWDSNASGCTKIKNQISRLASIGNKEKPEFVFAHLLVPHDPILIDHMGNCISAINYDVQTDNWVDFKKAYVGYLEYFNTAILEIIDDQKRSRGTIDRPLIFVIQSDEGPFPRSMRRGQLDFFRFSDEELVMKMGNINAILMPGDLQIPEEEMKTPINNWRLIMQSLLNSEFPMLEHRAFIYPETGIYDFREISPQLGLTSSATDPCNPK